MNHQRLVAAVNNLPSVSFDPASRGAAYLRTYPSFLAAIASPAVTSCPLTVAAGLAYAWMPRVLRLDTNHLNQAQAALSTAVAMDPTNLPANPWQTAGCNHLADCLRSVVGASKVLHFANPGAFPMWDKRVANNWAGRPVSQYFMAQQHNYVAYCNDVFQRIGDHRFALEVRQPFHNHFKSLLNSLGINPYCVADTRVVEFLAFTA